MRYEIDTTKILNQLLRYAWVIILAFAVGATSGYLYTSKIKADTYTASLSLVINSPQEGVAGISAAQNIIKTAVTVMRSDSFINENIIKETGVDMTPADIKSKTRFSIEEDSLIAYIRVTTDDPETSYKIARAFFDADFSYIDGKVRGVVVSNLDEPVMPETANAKNSNYTGFITGMVFMILAAVAIVFITVIDTCIRNEDDLASIRGDVPIIGMIPSYNQPSSGYGKYGGYKYRYSYVYGYGKSPTKKQSQKNESEKKEG